jgi:transcriptional regulator with XRE-family HTH domain
MFLVQKYEKGKDNISLQRIKQISDALKISALSLVAEELCVSDNDGISEEEIKLIMHLRRIKNKRLKSTLFDMVNDITKIQSR